MDLRTARTIRKKTQWDVRKSTTIRKKTQWDVRKSTGINQSKISLIEHGYIIPNNSERAAICKYLDFKIDEIDWPI